MEIRKNNHLTPTTRSKHRDYLRASAAHARHLNSPRLHQFRSKGGREGGGEKQRGSSYARRARKKCTAIIFRNAMSTIRETPLSRRTRTHAHALTSAGILVLRVPRKWHYTLGITIPYFALERIMLSHNFATPSPSRFLGMLITRFSRHVFLVF